MRDVGKYRAMARRLPQICSGNECGFKKKLEVHHIDNNPNNNILENLRMLCPDCHREVHGITLKTKYPKKYQKGTSKRKRK